MSDRLKQFGRGAISGADPSWTAAAARAAAAAVEPGYATAMRLRNRLYDAGVKRAHDLGRATVSVGNITTGGTGKTPVVGWLGRRLQAAGRRPAVLLRGYGADAAADSDEARLLAAELGDDVPVAADPSRVRAAAAVLAGRPDVDLFLLDDAFQHRRAARSFDLVLISATEPFGHGHVLPRGLLREPLAGLARADALLLTRCDGVDAASLARTEDVLRRHNPTAPIYRADHVHTGLWDPATGGYRPVEALTREPFFGVAAIGDPEAFDVQLRAFGPTYRGHRWYADHHRYSAADVNALRAAAGTAQLVTTDKDWTKLARVMGPRAGEISVLRLAIRFHGNDDQRLITQVLAAVTAR